MKQHYWPRYHPGITMHAIPIPATIGGLIFTVGMTIVFLVGVPIGLSVGPAALGRSGRAQLARSALRSLPGREWPGLHDSVRSNTASSSPTRSPRSAGAAA